jgi:hypothetical protein
MEDINKRNPTPMYDPAPPWHCYWKCYWKCLWWDPLPPFLKLNNNQLENLAALQKNMTEKMSEIYDETANKLAAIEERKNEEARKILQSKQ